MKEIWKWVRRYKPYLKVSNQGRVRCCKEIRYRIPTKNNWTRIKCRKIGIIKQSTSNGYSVIRFSLGLGSEQLRTHILVLEAFAGPCPEGMQCRHLNDIKDDNVWPRNLRWGTPSENGKDSYKNGLKTQRGENNNNATLKEKDIKQIRKLYREGKKVKAIAKEFGVNSIQIYRIINRKVWKDVA